MSLPKFEPGVKFWDVEGTPVAYGPGLVTGCRAFDTPESRPFSPESMRRNGAPISEAEFRTLVALSLQAPC